MKTILHLVLTHHWFDEIVHGDKRIEYRSMSDTWIKRIYRQRQTMKFVVFHRGYTSEKSIRKITKIDVGPCPYDGWNGEYIRIHFE